MTINNFTHLHVHTWYSFLDGFSSPKDLAERAKELGMTALAMTDHNHLGGAIEFQKACNDIGITPILGYEGYYTEDTNILSLSADERYDIAKEKAIENGVEIPSKITKKALRELVQDYLYDTSQHHILFLAKSQKGWHNLVKLQSESAMACTYNGRFLCDDALLEKYNEDVIMTTACIGNTLLDWLMDGQEDRAEKKIIKWKNIFKKDFYLEIQPLNIEKQHVMNKFLIKMAQKHNIDLIATNDVHYALYDDHDDHDSLLCVGTGKKKSEEVRIRYSNDFWLKSYDEMIESFEEQLTSMENAPENYMDLVRQALEQTNAIAEEISTIKIGADTPQMPDFEVDSTLSPEDYLTKQCFKELYNYKKKKPKIDIKVYEKRLHEELGVINSKGFAPYMLIVEDYVKNSDCAVGPGRGSGAGSLVLFLLGITKIADPIEHGLLFSRFLTQDRTSLPDIDLDFDFLNRRKVIRYLENKYSKENVSHIGTYSIMGVKSGVKDVARVLDLPFAEANNISKQLDEILDKPGPKFKDYDELKDSHLENDRMKWQQFDELEKKYKEIFRLARRFEGIPRQMGTHASGILVTPEPVIQNVPVMINKDGYKVTLYDGNQLEDLNYVKFA